MIRIFLSKFRILEIKMKMGTHCSLSAKKFQTCKTALKQCKRDVFGHLEIELIEEGTWQNSFISQDSN